MYLLIIFLPLLNSIFLGFFGFRLKKQDLFLLTSLNLFSALLLAYFLFYEVVCLETACSFKLSAWFETPVLEVSWGFLFDTLTVSMLIVILSISSCVHLYSMEYMSEDPHLKRFISYLSAFTFFMLILVSADNFFQMFIGWEGVGLCSYLLINFWFQRLQANKAALKAMIVNRVGDFGLSLGIFFLFSVFKTLDYTTISQLAGQIKQQYYFFGPYEISIMDLICFFIFIGCVGKSAQIGLHTWLPDAMEGPTPVSALIHAATMVTAGIFLLARASILFQYSPNILSLVTIMGALTAFLAGTTGLAQNDLKRVIAYSTCSQLGYMMFVAGLSAYNISFFHLSNHAFFKALLFLSAGSVIHALSDEQDMRKMGGLTENLVFTSVCLMIGSTALEGFPFSTGFYSKDMILEIANVFFCIDSFFASWLGNLSVATTAFYSTRSFFLTFLEDPLMPKTYITHIHEGSWKMNFPLFALILGSICIGFFTKDIFVGVGSNFWQNSVFIKLEQWTLFEAEYLEDWIKDIPLFFGLFGSVFAAFFYTEDLFFAKGFKWKISSLGQFIYTFLNRKWFFDKIYNEFISQKVLNIGFWHMYLNLDRGILELLGPHGLSAWLSNIALSYNNQFLLTDWLFKEWDFFLISFFLIISLTCIFIYLNNIFAFLIFFATILFLQLSLKNVN